jgi:hypothetical protein
MEECVTNNNEKNEGQIKILINKQGGNDVNNNHH